MPSLLHPISNLHAVHPRLPCRSPSWPCLISSTRTHGRLSFDDLPDVLKGVSLQVSGGLKVGVVGRTGSGKSSLLLALARLNQISSGSVSIDGVNISKVSLGALRSTLAVIPQQPHLFSGTLRFNLDPSGRFSDSALRQALKDVQLHTLLESVKAAGADSASTHRDGAGLGLMVQEGGSNLSVGERQLVSLARALLHRRPIVVMDEATANVDYDTDAIIQRIVRESEAIRTSTLVVVAHRLRTIMDADVVVVLERGKVVEIGSPRELLERHNSIFASMAAKASFRIEELAAIERLAAERKIRCEPARAAPDMHPVDITQGRNENPIKKLRQMSALAGSNMVLAGSDTADVAF
ncbi:hypothetical protein CYMTET_22365 [Cymbomonas tetramitiformis]|uniref:ABC transporter domain-containing protein n=1 Tax=Cymbomonas tetramitiformis TaxID=36881 RepID=A0AAE0L298_9CHLO|nr:hypothetical protein CYMTET_22365 [Cymbomonas tetramitiformis]